MLPRPPDRHVPSSAIAAFIDRSRIEKVLEPWIPDAAQRAFVVRCMLEEGPAHHRGANFIVLALLGELATRAGPPPAISAAETVAVPMHLPPHLEGSVEEAYYPLRFPRKVLEVLSKEPHAQQAMIDCLTDGPPQHSLSNAAMLCLLSVLLERAGGVASSGGAASGGAAPGTGGGAGTAGTAT